VSRVVRIIGFVLSLICMAVIVYLSFATDVLITNYVVGGDKGGHFLAYTTLSFLFLICFAVYSRNRILIRNLMPMLGAFSLSFVCAYCIELIQPYFHRTFEPADLLAGALGSLSGIIIGFFCVLLVCTIERRRASR